MDFRPLHANELPALHGYVARNPFRLADNSLGFLLMWRPYAHTALAEAEGCLLLRTAYGGKIRFAWPIHPEADPEAELRALAAVEAWCVSNGVPLALASVPVERLPLLTRRYGRDMVIENPRTWRDYLYNLSDFVDYPGRVACTIFTGGCNFRCPYCHNAPLVLDPSHQGVVGEEVIFDYLKKRRGVLQGVVITGGEPTLMPDLRDFILKIRELGYEIKLDSNGTRPDVLSSLIDEKIIDYLAMDIKNSKKRYAETVDIAGFDLTPVEESVSLLKKGAIPYEFRTTLVKEFIGAEDIAQIADWLEGAERYFLQHFKDSGNCIRGDLHEIDEKKANEFKTVAEKKIKHVALRGY